MFTKERRLGGVYRSSEVQALAVDSADIARVSTKEPLRSQELAECLREIAAETGHQRLWALEFITMLAAAGVMLLMFKSHAWRPLAGFGAMLGFLTMAASIGGYLISLKREYKGERA